MARAVCGLTHVIVAALCSCSLQKAGDTQICMKLDYQCLC